MSSYIPDWALQLYSGAELGTDVTLGSWHVRQYKHDQSRVLQLTFTPMNYWVIFFLQGNDKRAAQDDKPTAIFFPFTKSLFSLVEDYFQIRHSVSEWTLTILLTGAIDRTIIQWFIILVLVLWTKVLMGRIWVLMTLQTITKELAFLDVAQICTGVWKHFKCTFYSKCLRCQKRRVWIKNVLYQFTAKNVCRQKKNY